MKDLKVELMNKLSIEILDNDFYAELFNRILELKQQSEVKNA